MDPDRKPTKRQRTRAALIDAAVEVIREKGFYETTLEEVARRAGMSRGAIYGNFRNKDDLFLAVVEARWRPLVPVRAGVNLRAHLRTLGEAVVAAIPARRAQALGALSFHVYALAHDDMRSKIARLNADLYRRGADQMQPMSAELPMPADRFVRVLHALTDGLLFLRFLMPDDFSDELIVGAFEAFARQAGR
jgi:AcrR family transcriptional regulator